MNIPSDHDLAAAVRALVPGAVAVYLFGSRADGDQRPDSDLDLAVLAEGPLAPVALWDAAQSLAIRFDCDVDLVDLRTASTVLQHQIITTGRRLFGQGGVVERFEIFVLSEMTSLNEARAPLLADIARDGFVHAR